MKTQRKILSLVLALSTLFCCFANLYVKAAQIDVSEYTYVVDNMTFYKGDNEINSLDGATEVAVDVTRRVAGGDKDRLIISTYSDTGEYIGMYSVTHHIDFAKTSNVKVLLNIPEGKTLGEVKAYVWKSFSDMIPLSNVLSSNNNMIIDPKLEYEKELQTTFTDVSVNDSFAEAVSLITYLGIMNGYEDGTFRPTSNIRVADAARMITYMTKGEFLASLLQDEQLVSDEIPSSIERGYINYCVDSKYLIPDANGYVNYNSNITVKDFLILTMNSLGYYQMAKASGGWPRGYIKFATELGFENLTDYNYSAHITRGEAAKILVQAINWPIAEIVGYTYTASGEVVPKDQIQDGVQSQYYKSILTKHFGLYTVEGYVTSTSKDNAALKPYEVDFSITSSKKYTAEDLQVYNSPTGSDILLCNVNVGDTSAADYAGIYSTAILKLDKNDNWSIVRFTPSDKNVSVTFDKSALDTNDYKDEFGNLMHSYWAATQTASPYLKFFADGTTVSTKYPLSYNVNVYVNGVRSPMADSVWEYVINGNTDKITLVDTYKTDGKYDTIHVNNYVTAMVDSVSSTGKITFSSDTIGAGSLILDDEDETLDYHIYLDGEEITPAELQKNDILTIAYNIMSSTSPKAALACSKFYEIYVSRDVVTGTLSAKYDESYTIKIDNTTYSFINSAMYALFDSVSKLGDNYKLYLDSFGKIYKYEICASAANWAIAEKFTKSSSDDDYKLTMVTADGTTKSYYFDASKATVIRPDGMRIDKNTEGSESALNQAIVNLIYSTGYYSKNPIDTRVIQYKVSSSSGMITELKFIAPSADTIASASMREEYKASTNTIGSIKLGDSTKIIDATRYFSDEELLASTVSNLVDEVAYKAYAYGPKVDGVYPFVLITEGEAGYNKKTRFAVVTKEGYSEETDAETGDIIYSIKAMYGDATELIVSDDVSTASLARLKQSDIIYFQTNSKGYITDFDVIFSLGSSMPLKPMLAINSLVNNNTIYSNLVGITIPTEFSSYFSTDFTTNWTDSNSDAIKLVYGPIIERTDYDISFGKIDENNQTNTLGNKNDANGVVMYDFAKDLNVYTYNYYMPKDYKFEYSGSDISQIASSDILPANMESDGCTITWNKVVDSEYVNHNDVSLAFAVVVDNEVVDIFNLKSEYDSTDTTTPVTPNTGDTITFDISSLDTNVYEDNYGAMVQLQWTAIKTSSAPYLEFYENDNIYSTKYMLADSANMSVYVNGVKVTTGDPIWDYVINGDVGEVKLVCTGNVSGRFDEIYVNSYVSGMVSGINTAGKILLDNAAYGIASLTLDDSVDYNIYLDGEEIAISDLQANDVISVTYDVTAGTTPKSAFAASKFYEVYVSRNVITDILKGKNADNYEVKFGDTYYPFASSAMYSVFASSSMIGDEYTLYFDAFGRIFKTEINTVAANWAIAEKFTISSSDDNYKLTMITADGTTNAYYFDASKANVEIDGITYNRATEGTEAALNAKVLDLIYTTAPVKEAIENRVIQYKVSSSSGMITELKFIPVSKDTLGGVYGQEAFSARRYTIGTIKLDTSTKIIDATRYASDEKLSFKSVTNLDDGTSYEAYAYGETTNGVSPFVLITEANMSERAYAIVDGFIEGNSIDTSYIDLYNAEEEITYTYHFDATDSKITYSDGTTKYTADYSSISNFCQTMYSLTNADVNITDRIVSYRVNYEKGSCIEELTFLPVSVKTETMNKFDADTLTIGDISLTADSLIINADSYLTYNPDSFINGIECEAYAYDVSSDGSYPLVVVTATGAIDTTAVNWGVAEKFTLSSSDDDYKLTLFTADGATKSYYFDASRASVEIDGITCNKVTEGTEAALEDRVKNQIYTDSYSSMMKQSIESRVVQYRVSSSTGKIVSLKFIDQSIDTLSGVGGNEEFRATNNLIGSIRLGDTTKIINATKYAMDNELAVTSPSNLVDEVAYKAYAYGTKVDGAFPFVLITEGEAAYNKRTRFAVMTESGYSEELDPETDNIIYTLSAMYGDTTELIVTDDVSTAMLNSLNAGDVFFFKTNSNGHITDIDVLLSFDGSVPSQHILANNSLVDINTNYAHIINPYIQSSFSPDFSSDFTTAWTGVHSDAIQVIYGPVIDKTDSDISFGKVTKNASGLTYYDDYTGTQKTYTGPVTNLSGNEYDADGIVTFDFADDVNVYTYDYSMSKDYRFNYEGSSTSAILPSKFLDRYMINDYIPWHLSVDYATPNMESANFAFAVVAEGKIVDILAFLSK